MAAIYRFQEDNDEAGLSAHDPLVVFPTPLCPFLVVDHDAPELLLLLPRLLPHHLEDVPVTNDSVRRSVWPDFDPFDHPQVTHHRRNQIIPLIIYLFIFLAQFAASDETKANIESRHLKAFFVVLGFTKLIYSWLRQP